MWPRTRRAGERDAALTTFARAQELHPANAMVLVNTGAVYVMAGDRAPARQAYLRLAPAALEARDIARVRAWLGGGWEGS